MSNRTERSIAVATIPTVATAAVGRAVVEPISVGQAIEETRRTTAGAKADHENTAKSHGNGQQDIFE